MLTFPLTRSGDLLVARDHVAMDRLYIASRHVYVTRHHGNSVNMQLLTWMSAGGSEDVAGGRLNANLSVFPDTTSIRAAGFDPRNVKPMPWRNVTVTLRGPGFETSPSQVVLRNNGEALVSIDLNRETVLVLRNAFENPGLTPLSTEWSGVVDLHFPAIHVQASASRTVIESRVRHLGEGMTSDVLKSVISANVQIQITAGTDEEAQRLIQDWCLNEITRRFVDNRTLLIKVNAADIITWPISINSTLSLDAVDNSNSSSIILSDHELGAQQSSSIRVLADFNENLNRVDVELKVNSDIETMAFTDTESQEFVRPASSYMWRWRANYATETTAWSGWTLEQPSPTLLITVNLPEVRTVEIIAGRIDLEETWEKVVVTVLSMTQEPFSNPFLITDQSRSITLEGNQLLGANLDVQAHFIAFSGQAIIRTQRLMATETVLALNDPFTEDTFSVTLVPVGSGWRDVALAMVDLRLVDGDETWAGTRTLDTLDSSAQWRAPKRPGKKDIFDWRTHISYRDGTFKTSNWQQSDSTLLSVRLDLPSLREVLILALNLKPEEEVIVQIRQDGEKQSTSLSNKSQIKIELPPGEFTWFAQWQLGDQRVIGEQISTSADVIILPPSPITPT